MKGKVRKIDIEFVCPYCSMLTIIRAHSPQQLHQDSHLTECWNCFKDIYWSIKVQGNLEGMPEYIEPVSSH